MLTLAAALAGCTSSDPQEGATSTDAPNTTTVATSAPATTPPPTEPTVAVPETIPGGDQPLGLDPAGHVATLENGLTTIVRHNERPGASVDLRLVIDAGSMLEEPDQSGVAHFLEHMMFNGTAKYPKNELTATLQSFGASFGADINAYTSYDETVYQLTVPNDADAVATGIDILHEWLTAATLNPDDVTAERGVVHDELRQYNESSDGRAYTAFEEAMLAGSPYAGHNVGGREQAIDAMTPEPLRRFYDRWYRPDNATVIVVGEIEVAEMQGKLSAAFGSAVSRDASPLNRPEASWSPSSAPIVSVHSDPDVADSSIELALVGTAADAAAGRDLTLADLHEGMFDQLVTTLMVNRMNDGMRRGTVPITQVGADHQSYVRAMSFAGIYVSPSSGRTADALEALLDEVHRAVTDGFEPAEVERAVAAVQSQLDEVRAGAGTIQDPQLADGYVAHVLTGADAGTAEPEAAYAAGGEVLRRATPEALSTWFASRWSPERAALLVSVPAKGDDVASDADLRDELVNLVTRKTRVGAGGQPTDADALMARPEPVTEASAEDLDGDGYDIEPRELHFANGLDVVLSRNTIVDGDITISAVRLGGLSAVDDARIPAARVADQVVPVSSLGSLDAVTVGHVLDATGIDVTASLLPEQATMDGSTPTADLEVAMAYMRQMIADPHVDDPALANAVDAARTAYEGLDADPDMATFQAQSVARYGDNPRYRNLLTSAELDSVTSADVLSVWKERFGDATGWRVVFVGDLDVDEATALARAYFGTLTGTNVAPQFAPLEPPVPSGLVGVQVNAGTGERASLVRTNEAPIDDPARADMLAEMLTSVINMRLTATLREELGASYSPQAYVYVESTPSPAVNMQIYVTGAPERIGDLHAVLDRELADIAANGPSATESKDAFTEATRNTDYIDSVSIAYALSDMVVRPSGLSDYLDRANTVDKLDADDLADFAASLLATDQYIEITTLPAGG